MGKIIRQLTKVTKFCMCVQNKANWAEQPKNVAGL
jgi:hypothetical protein